MDNKIDIILNKIIKTLLVSVICITLIITLLFITPVSVHADSSNFYDVPYYSGGNAGATNSTIKQNGVIAFSYSSIDYYSCYTCSSPIYPFIYKDDNDDTVGHIGAICSSLETDERGYCFFAWGASASNYFGITIQSRNFNDYGCYVNTYANNFQLNSFTSNIPIFDSLDDAIDSFISSSVLTYNNTLTIEPGYVAYCLCEGGSVVLNAIMPLNSNLNIAGKPKWDSMARIAFGVYRPDSGTILTDSFGNLINWHKNGTAPSNILGMTKYAQAIYNDLPSDGSFVAIYNPAYYGDDMSNPMQAPSITASFTNLGAVAKYPINTHVSYTPTLGWNIQSGSDSDWNEYGIAMPTTDGAINTSDYIMSTTSEPAIVFPDGGYNDSNAVNNDPGSVLQRIIQPIINLLKAPFEHINNLISSGSAFMREIGQFFSWLPEAVNVIIIDALIVCIVIGVLKLLF